MAIGNTYVDRVIARALAAPHPKVTYVPSEERLQAIGADVDAEKETVTKLRRELAVTKQQLTVAEQQLADEQVKRVRAESDLAWLTRDLQALSDRWATELNMLGHVL